MKRGYVIRLGDKYLAGVSGETADTLDGAHNYVGLDFAQCVARNNDGCVEDDPRDWAEEK